MDNIIMNQKIKDNEFVSLKFMYDAKILAYKYLLHRNMVVTLDESIYENIVEKGYVVVDATDEHIH